jgi:hypothetical protein
MGQEQTLEFPGGPQPAGVGGPAEPGWPGGGPPRHRPWGTVVFVPAIIALVGCSIALGWELARNHPASSAPAATAQPPGSGLQGAGQGGNPLAQALKGLATKGTLTLSQAEAVRSEIQGQLQARGGQAGGQNRLATLTAQGGPLDTALKQLVANGTITQAQADATKGAILQAVTQRGSG